jgi:hypothetical protein
MLPIFNCLNLYRLFMNQAIAVDPKGISRMQYRLMGEILDFEKQGYYRPVRNHLSA